MVKTWVQNLIGYFEGHAYITLGQYYIEENIAEGYQAARTHFEKARDTCENIKHDEIRVHLVDKAKIEIEKLELKFIGGNVTPDEKIRAAKAEYDFWATGAGKEKLGTLQKGAYLVFSLHTGARVIEAQRLSMELLAICKQVHGPFHEITINLTSCLEICKKRFVKIPSMDTGDKVDWYQALRFEEDGEMCVVQGPLATARNMKTHKVGFNEIILTPGTPVSCKTAANDPDGKVGEVQDWDGENSVYEVHFEDKELDPCLVKHELLKILFELPEMSE
ncbi:hypothetical protein ACHAWF_002443 [Thalassiosira exigua]